MTKRVRRNYPFYLDMSLIFGLDAKDIDDAEEKVREAVEEIYKALKDKSNILSLSVYSVYQKDRLNNGFKVVLQGEKRS